MKCGCNLLIFVIASKKNSIGPNEFDSQMGYVNALQTPASSWLGLVRSGEHLGDLLCLPFTFIDHQGWSSARRS